MVSTTSYNAWRELSPFWQKQIAMQCMGMLWKQHFQNLNFAVWCINSYPQLVCKPSDAAKFSRSYASVFIPTNAPLYPQTNTSAFIPSNATMSNQFRASQLILKQERAVRNIFPEWWFNHILTSRERNSLLCTLTKLRIENLLDRVKDLTFVGQSCEIDFEPTRGSEDFHQYLLQNGYGDWWSARKSGHRCGVRSRFQGLQLHFRCKNSDIVNAHIDSFNPGDPPKGPPTGGARELGDAVEHFVADSVNRSITDDPILVRGKLVFQAYEKGIAVPRVH